MKFVVIATLCAIASAQQWAEQTAYTTSSCDTGKEVRKIYSKADTCFRDTEQTNVYYKFTCSTSGVATRMQYSTSGCTGTASSTVALSSTCQTVNNEYIKGVCSSFSPTAMTGIGSGNIKTYSGTTCTGTGSSDTDTYNDMCKTATNGQYEKIGCGSSGASERIDTSTFTDSTCTSGNFISLDSRILSVSTCSQTGASKSAQISSYNCSPAVAAVPAAVTALFALVLAALRN